MSSIIENFYKIFLDETAPTHSYNKKNIIKVSLSFFRCQIFFFFLKLNLSNKKFIYKICIKKEIYCYIGVRLSKKRQICFHDRVNYSRQIFVVNLFSYVLTYFFCSTYFLMTELYVRLKSVGRLYILYGGRFFYLCCGRFVDGNLGLCKPNLI